MIAELNFYFLQAKQHLPLMLQILAIMWAVNIVNWYVLNSKLNILGIYPRNLIGIIGIPFSPILHANFNHLFFNSIPFFVLGLFILSLGLIVFLKVTIALIVLEGLLVWLFARKAIHIGASGIISGYFGFILSMAYSAPSAVTIILAIVAVYYFGAILFGIFPTSDNISWESHFLGFASGIGIGLAPHTWLPS